MKLLVFCSLIAITLAAPGGFFGFDHGVAVGAPAIAAPVAPVIVPAAPAIVKTVAPSATSYTTISQVQVSHPTPLVKVAAPVAVAQPIVKYAATPAISVAHPVAVAHPAPALYSGHGFAFH